MISSAMSKTSKLTSLFTAFAYLFILKSNWFHLNLGLYLKRSQKTSLCGKNISASCGPFFVQTTFWRYLWSSLNRPTETWYLFVLKFDEYLCSGVLTTVKSHDWIWSILYDLQKDELSLISEWFIINSYITV